MPCVGVAGAIQEAARLRDDLESGELYDSLAEEVGLSRKDAKESLLEAFNGENGHTYNDKTFKAFARRFPIAKQVIGKIRNGYRKRLNQKMAHTLSKAIDKSIQTCWEYKIPCYPRTDEIVCRKRDADFVREVLAAYFLDETGVNAKIGKERVSFITTEEEVWNQFSVRYDLENYTNRQAKKIEDDLPLWNCVKMARLSKGVQKQSQIAA
jgi:plasmid maintenance system antidote protein VapI